MSAADVDLLRLPPPAPPHPVAKPGFVGREAEIDRLAKLMDSDRRVHVLAGPPGIGKTSIALAAAGKVSGALWVPARDTVSFVEAMAAVAREIGVDEASVARCREMCGSRLDDDAAGPRAFAWTLVREEALRNTDGRRRMLVIDGADDPDAYLQILQEAVSLPSSRWLTVVTTSYTATALLPAGVHHETVEPPSREECAAILLGRVPDLDPSRHEAALPVAEQTAELLGRLPLAVHVAGSQHGSPVVRHTLTAYADELKGHAGADPVRVAVRLATDAVSADRLAALAVLRLLAAMAPAAPFPLDMLDAAADRMPDDPEIRRGWRTLRDTGLLEFGVDNGVHVATLHPLVGAAVAGGEPGPDPAAALDAATRALDTPSEPALRVWLLLVPHVQRVLAEDGPASGAALRAACRTVRHLLRRGMYRVAAALADRAVERSATLAPDNPDRLGALLHRGLARQALGRYRPALQDVRQVATIERRRRGAPDPAARARRLEIEYHLAAILHDCGARGGLVRAERLLRAVRKLRSDLLGPDHPDTLTTGYRLGLVLQAAGRPREALAELDAVVAARSQEHPDTLTAMQARAYARQAIGGADSLRQAGQDFKQVLDLRIGVLGEYHPNTLITQHNLAWVEQAKGRYVAAETLFRDVLALQLRRCGPDHPHTLATAANLAWDLLQRKQFAPSRQLFEQVLRIRERRLGLNHPDTQTTRGNLGWLTYEEGKLDEAVDRLTDLVSDRVRSLGAEHPRTLTTRHNLALSLRSQRKYDEALDQFDEVLRIQSRVIGPGHESTLSTTYNYAVTLRMHGGDKMLDRSIDMFGEVLDRQLTVFSSRHPSVVQTREQLIAALRQRGTAADLDRASDERTPSRAAQALSRHRTDREYDDEPRPPLSRDPLLAALLAG
ncbi:tetratricopeptide repeat protein [Actinoplanes sp. NPDC024001]|uniref:tetratricopeptide repeat protein n=1 Tax=Actinoplanes sp. NPDC024001 TaxID=3154598 RepID=UPI0033CE189E